MDKYPPLSIFIGTHFVPVKPAKVVKTSCSGDVATWRNSASHYPRPVQIDHVELVLGQNVPQQEFAVRTGRQKVPAIRHHVPLRSQVREIG